VNTLTAGQALDRMRRAVLRYETACADFARRGEAWGRRYSDPVTAESRRRSDPTRADLSADAVWAREEARMYAAVATALATDRQEVAR
jgi:hypothetical protein